MLVNKFFGNSHIGYPNKFVIFPYKIILGDSKENSESEFLYRNTEGLILVKEDFEARLMFSKIFETINIVSSVILCEMTKEEYYESLKTTIDLRVK